MSKVYNLQNQRFGRLLVLSLEGTSKKGKIWNCKCDCGKEIKRLTCLLTTGKTQSCGCLKKDTAAKMGLSTKGRACVNRLPDLVGAFNALRNDYKKKAKQRNLNFNLTDDEIKELIFKNCFYCNALPTNKRESHPNSGKLIFNGIDRKNSNLGYSVENCVPCCKYCNKMKQDLDYHLFLDQCSKISERFKNGIG
jgi:hypothetical protein